MKWHYYRNEYFQIVPASEEDFEVIKKMTIGEVYESNIKKTRNYEFHKKFFKLVQKGFENTKTKIKDVDFYRYYITMKAGFFESVETGTGKMILPRSIKFDKMDNIEFQELYNAVFNQIIIDIECDEVLFRNELSSFL